jgi:hypothetical protein
MSKVWSPFKIQRRPLIGSSVIVSSELLVSEFGFREIVNRVAHYSGLRVQTFEKGIFFFELESREHGLADHSLNSPQSEPSTQHPAPSRDYGASTGTGTVPYWVRYSFYGFISFFFGLLMTP